MYCIWGFPYRDSCRWMLYNTQLTFTQPLLARTNLKSLQGIFNFLGPGRNAFHFKDSPVKCNPVIFHILWEIFLRYTPPHDWRCVINSLWPSETMWWHTSGSTLAQVMACCLMAPNHYPNQCLWVIVESTCLSIFLSVCLQLDNHHFWMVASSVLIIIGFEWKFVHQLHKV